MEKLREKVLNSVWGLFSEGYKRTINRAEFDKKLNSFLDDELLDWEACGKIQKRLYDDLEEKFLKCQNDYLKLIPLKSIVKNNFVFAKYKNWDGEIKIQVIEAETEKEVSVLLKNHGMEEIEVKQIYFSTDGNNT